MDLCEADTDQHEETKRHEIQGSLENPTSEFIIIVLCSKISEQKRKWVWKKVLPWS